MLRCGSFGCETRISEGNRRVPRGANLREKFLDAAWRDACSDFQSGNFRARVLRAIARASPLCAEARRNAASAARAGSIAASREIGSEQSTMGIPFLSRTMSGHAHAGGGRSAVRAWQTEKKKAAALPQPPGEGRTSGLAQKSSLAPTWMRQRDMPLSRLKPVGVAANRGRMRPSVP